MAACAPLIGGVMGAKEAFERTFRQLIMTMPYSKITVTELCRKAHLSRKTFYSTFQDKEAVLESIFVEDVVVEVHRRGLGQIQIRMVVVEHGTSLSGGGLFHGPRPEGTRFMACRR